MSKYTDLAMERRTHIGQDGRPVYNCAQAVVSVFAQDAGYDEDAALRAATYFRGGMQMGAVCGAVTGGLMALGFAGLKDAAISNEFIGKVKSAHEDLINCKELLAASAARGEVKKTFCDALICACVDLVEEALREKGILP
ncbi:MAG: C_GCAxxG_C_C family protein [Clostridia bacterium]|nr:C_GCAxxG_C_C family protein [Clostridia bacterium]